MPALIAITNPETQETALRLVKRPQQLRLDAGINTDYELVLELRRAYRRTVVCGTILLALFATATAWTLTRGHVRDTPMTMESFR